MSSVLELHPDELLDKDARGELTADEEARLSAHLVHCSACRLEREVARDFRMDLAGGDSDLELESLVTRALAGAKTSEEEPSALDKDEDAEDTPPESERAPRVAKLKGRRRRIAPMLVAAACAVLSVVGIAAAAEWTGVFHSKSEGAAGGSEVTSKTNTVAALPSTTLPSPPSTISAAATQEEPALAVPSEAPLAQPIPTAATVDGPKLPASVANHANHANHAEPQAPQPTPAPEAPPAPVVDVAPSATAPVAPVPDASSMFAAANLAKARGQHGEAVRAYRDLQRSYPGSPEARLANAIVGRLLLDDGHAQDALAALDRYLQSGDTALREEALVARATALGRLGRRDEERATWKQLLQNYPQSMHAKRAEARLAETGPR